jgi:hypothetical protein
MSVQILTRDLEVVCGEARSRGKLLVQCFTPRERFSRALKVAFLCVAVLIAVACIPGVHFVAVPVMLVVSPFVILKVWRAPSVIKDIDAVCAKCQGKLTTLNTKERYPLYETCLSCQRENRLNLVIQA